jgi:transglutaminase-like putative cysteine protease
MPIPTQWDTQKDIKLLNFTPEPSDIFIESQGNHIVFWGNVLEYGTPTIFEEELELSILQKLWQIEEDSIGNYDPLDPVLTKYLGSSEYIQTDHPTLQEAANSVVGTETNPYIKAKRLFNFVVDRMIGFTEGINDALGAFNSQQGECGGYSNLFIALCRAVGVPARPITGIAEIKEGSYHWANGDVHTHMWAEFYLPNYGWIPADPIANILGIAYGDRLILSKGADIELGHGISQIPWFHMPYVNEHQEKGDDLILTVQVL